MNVFEAKTATDTLLEGAARTDGPQASDGVVWRYEALFKVAIPPPPKTM